MSFRYIVVCDQEGCHRQQGILTPDHGVRNDGGGVYPEELQALGWEEDALGRHTCPFCADPCPECDGTGRIDFEHLGHADCKACDGSGWAGRKKRRGDN